MARLPALFALEARLSDDCCVILDDAMRHRRGGAAIWRQRLPWSESYTIGGPTGLAVFRRRVTSGGPAADTTPQRSSSGDSRDEQASLEGRNHS